jgi:hypothetical protein
MTYDTYESESVIAEVRASHYVRIAKLTREFSENPSRRKEIDAKLTEAEAWLEGFEEELGPFDRRLCQRVKR